MTTERGNIIKKLLYIFIALIGMVGTPALACESNQIDVAGDGSNCVDSKFEVTTTSLSAGDVFTFLLSPKGTFYIDCDGGALSEDTPNVNEPPVTITGDKTVTRTNANNGYQTYYTCTYSTGGVKHIRLAGRATEYNGNNATMPTIRFGGGGSATGNLVESISGSLGQIFPVIGNGGADRLTPKFYNTFAGTNITTIPADLFDGIRGCGAYMFFQTFSGSQITSIPAHLFDGIICPRAELFRGTFNGTKITSIPEGLYKNVAYPAGISTAYLNDMFYLGFNGNQNLTGYIPPSLLGDLNNTNLYGSSTMHRMFDNNPSLATECPAGTEQYTTGYEQYFSGHVACKKTGLITCAPGEYLPKRYNNCQPCNPDYTCSGGDFYFSDTTDQGALYDIVTCEAGYYLPANSRQCATCPNSYHCVSSTYRFNATTAQGLSTCQGEKFDVDGTCVDSKFSVTTTNLSVGESFKFSLGAIGTFYVDCGVGGTLTSDADPSDVSGKTITRSSGTPALYTCSYSTGGVKTIQFGGLATNYYYSDTWNNAPISFYVGGNGTPTLIRSVYGSLGTIFPMKTSSFGPRFYRTFQGTTNLTSIPSTLFNGIVGGYSHMFFETFAGSGITSIPADLFKDISGGYGLLFYGTFAGTQITSIPENLFDGITAPTSQEFRGTFNGTKITSIPEGLFKNVSYGANSNIQYLFYGLFANNSELTGYIPPALFGDLNKSGRYDNTMTSIFDNSPNLATTCPTGTAQYITGYEQYFDGHVACYKTGTITCNPGEYLPKYFNNCIACPDNFDCAGGEFYFDDTANQGIPTCPRTQFEVDGTCVDSKFEVTTTNLNANDEFKFSMTATGTFYVDCGNGGTLSSDAATPDVNGKTITRGGMTQVLYTCSYSTGGVKTIRFGGVATNYSNQWNGSAISFWGSTGDTATGTPTLIDSVSGSLGALFPTVSSGNKIPRFYRTFQGATNLTSIPADLFLGISGGVGNMFEKTFYRCTSLSSIPEDLFVNITISNNMFYQTFASCSSITQIPGNLFQNIRGSANMLFYSTFAGTGITSIPENLFANVTGAATQMFAYTFIDTNITTIPANLFAGVRGAAPSMFYQTFKNCRSLTTIPSGLFAGVSGTAHDMFGETFANDSALTSIPDNLFAGVTGAESNLFKWTFQNCTGLRGYIPLSLFAGLIENNVAYSSAMMNGIFSGATGLDTTCPSGKTQFTTGYESYWDGRVACIDSYINCDPGEYLAAHQYTCSVCPENNYCTGGSCQYNESGDSCITPCGNGLFSPKGRWASDQCGRILHVGDKYLYLRASQVTTPSLHVDVDNDGTADYFGNMTTTAVPMSIEYVGLSSGNKLAISIPEDYTAPNGTTVTAGTYYVHDDTVDPTKQYIKLDYIESSGTQCIDTGIYWKYGYSLEMDMTSINNTGNYAIFGASNGNSYNTGEVALFWHRSGGTSRFECVYPTANNSSTVAQITPYLAATRYLIEYTNTALNVTTGGNTLTAALNVYSSYVGTKTLALFATHRTSINNYGGAFKMHYTKIYDENSVLVRNFIPVARVSDSAIGMYDTVNQVFYTNSGTGAFTAGPVASNQSF